MCPNNQNGRSVCFNTKLARAPAAPRREAPMHTRPAARLAAALLAVGLVLTALPLRAQVADAVIEIVALDQTDQLLPGVTLTISRPETGFAQTIVTDAAGLARLPAVPPGTYSIKAELAGF